MIPKIIHYCWLSDEPIPAKLQKCINSWKKYCPDYEIIKWDTKRFDVNSCGLTKEAFAAKKWAFAADYIRTYALYTMGGIYLDSDVLLFRKLDNLLDAGFISSYEYHPNDEDLNHMREIVDETGKRNGVDFKIKGVGIQAAIIGSEKGHPLLNDILAFYEKISLGEILDKNYTAPTVYAYHAEKYGFRYINEKQSLEERIIIYPTSVFGNFDQYSRKSYAIHCCAGSWLDKDDSNKNLKMLIKTNRFLLVLFKSFKKFFSKKRCN